MKTCSECYRLYPDDGGFCPIDGSKLLLLSEATLPSEPTDKRVGKTLCDGKYQIWRIIADGGMGRVYQAFGVQSGRNLALKILHPSVAGDSISVERFKREYEVGSSLSHPNIVEVIAFDRTEDNSYALVMEYLEGEELRTLLKRDKVLKPARLIRMMSQVALGLVSSHERKIVHRDLKPDNIFLCGTRDGDDVKILDFGSVRDNSASAKKLTMLGTTIGSPFYMAPEQAQGLASLDHRADVWSVAAIAYECLTGKVPFEGTSGPSILLAILTRDPIPPSEAGADYAVPKSLNSVFEEGLAKMPEHRFQTVGALVHAMGAALGLKGEYEDWAKTSETELSARIADGLPKALAAMEAPRHTEAMDNALVQTPQVAESPSAIASAATSFDEDIVMGVPDKSSSRLGIWIGVGIFIICVIIAVVWAFK